MPTSESIFGKHDMALIVVTLAATVGVVRHPAFAADGGAAPSDPASSGPASSAPASSNAPAAHPAPAPEPPLKGAVKDLFERAMVQAKGGDLQGAAKTLREALGKDSRASRVASALGLIYDRLGQEKEATEAFRAALRARPDDARAARGLATMALRDGSPERALELVEPIAKQHPTTRDLQALYGELLVLVGRTENAMTVARQVLREDERNVGAMLVLVRANLKLGRLELADAIMEQVAGIDPTDADLNFLRAQRYLDDRRPGDAIKALIQAVEVRPDFVDAQLKLGSLYLRGGNYEKALEHLKSADLHAGKLPEVQLAMGEAYRSLRRWPDAKNAFTRVLQADPKNADAHYDLGLLYMESATQPGNDPIATMQSAMTEFNTYRDLMGARATRNDPVEGYLSDLARAIEREKKRIERAKAQEARRQRAEAEAAKEKEQQAAEPKEGGEKPAKEGE